MRTLLVTGGAGFIGANFIHYYFKNHSESRIVNLDLLTYAGNLDNLKAIPDSERYRFIRGDIGDRELVQKIFGQENIEAVVNFAAESHVDRSITGPELFVKANVLGTFMLLECARESWKEDTENRRFLHVSTDEVFGSLGPDGFFTESTKYAPNSPYSASKAASDHFARAYHHTYGLPVLITNCSNNYGPYQFPEKLIPLIINNVLGKKPLPVYGDGKNIRDWLFVEDHCRALDRVLEKGAPGETYNIGGNNEWANIDIINLVCSIMDQKLERSEKDSSKNLISFVKDRPGHDRRYAIDASKIKKELGWQPQETFETGIEKTITWYLDNREWVKNIVSGDYKEYYKKMYSGR